jgi:hypothetical protein
VEFVGDGHGIPLQEGAKFSDAYRHSSPPMLAEAQFGNLDVRLASAATRGAVSSQNPTGLLLEINGTKTGI